MGKGCWALSGCWEQRLAQGRRAGCTAWLVGRGEVQGKVSVVRKANPIAQDAAAASVGASVSEAASLPLSHFCLLSTWLESTHAPAPQEELSCFSSTWWLAGLWRRGFASGTGP